MHDLAITFNKTEGSVEELKSLGISIIKTIQLDHADNLMVECLLSSATLEKLQPMRGKYLWAINTEEYFQLAVDWATKDIKNLTREVEEDNNQLAFGVCDSLCKYLVDKSNTSLRASFTFNCQLYWASAVDVNLQLN